MKSAKFLRRNVYRWHRITSLLIAVPVILWALSGFLHPVVGSFKPRINNQSLPPAFIDLYKIKIPLGEALQKHGIDSIEKFRIISWNQNYYYQVKMFSVDVPVYLDCNNGDVVIDGDRKYAAHLAERYLSEPNQQKNSEGMPHHGAEADAGSVLSSLATGKNKAYKPGIRSITLLQEFTPEYKRSNVLLPVYRVSFERKDNIRLYIETSTGKLAAAIDDRKAWFARFFSLTHSWSFLDSMGKTKNILLGLISLLCFLSSLAGFYVYNLTSTKKQTAKRNNNRYVHRILGNIFVLTTVMYSVSGAWHSFHKLPGKNIIESRIPSVFKPGQLNCTLQELESRVDKDKTITGVSMINMNGRNYWQIDLLCGKDKYKNYLNAQTFELLNDGDARYAHYLASWFAGQPERMIRNTHKISQYNNRYSMMNRRLPVMEVEFEKGPCYYVETSSGRLAAIAGERDQWERFSFSNLHMHHYWEDWLGKEEGKTVQKYFLIASTLGLLLLVLTGVGLYFSRRLKKQKAANPQ